MKTWSMDRTQITFFVYLNGSWRFEHGGDWEGFPRVFKRGNINKIIHNQHEA